MKNFSFDINYFHRFSSIFWIFLTFPRYKETNEVSLQQMMSAFFDFQHAWNRLFNNSIKLYWYQLRSSWNIKGGRGKGEGGQIDSPPEKNTLKKHSFITVNSTGFDKCNLVKVRYYVFQVIISMIFWVEKVVSQNIDLD